MNYTAWNIPNVSAAPPMALLDAGFSPLLSSILNLRGLSDPAAAHAFLDCGAEALGDPFAMADMSAAVTRLRRAIAAREHVAVYGDYDVDGITSSCMLADYLRSKDLPCELYIPDRIEEGYGLNTGAIDTLKAAGVRLIVTVDCGVTTVQEADYAAAQGIDLIITDHHECRETLPRAVAVVDPKRPDCAYPSHDLAGVGVAFQLLCALEGDAETVLARYADLVAVGTVADVMPLTGENRYIVRRGLEKLTAAPRPGLKMLIEEAGLSEKKITASTVGYTLSPRLNAAGRLGRVDLAVSLLLSESPAQAAECAAALCQLNRDRQALETEIWQQALALLGDTVPTGPLVLAHEDWHQGVVGIAASRLSETYQVPAIMICLDGDKGKGSCRSCGDFNLFEALSACADLLEGFGGHALAAGLTIRRENIPAFRAAITEYYRAHPPKTSATLEIELHLDEPALLMMEYVERLDLLEPCGAGNPRPLMCMLGMRLAELTPIGGGRHLRLRLEKYAQSYEAVFFSHTAEDLGVRVGDWVDIAFHPQINEFRSRRSVQLLITDLRPYDDSRSRAIFAGEPRAEFLPFLPAREQFSRVWTRMKSLGGAFRGPIPAVMEQIWPLYREDTFCLIIKTFAQIGLLTYSLDAHELTISCTVDPEKTQLDASPLLKTLKEMKAKELGCRVKDL